MSCRTSRRRPEPRSAFLASYMLLASYLKWDLRDILEGSPIEDPVVRRRVQGLRELLVAAERGYNPIYGTDMPREERIARLASREDDENALEVVKTAHARDGGMPSWYFIERGQTLLAKIEEGRWESPADKGDRVFVEESLLPFLDRLQHIADR